MRNVYIHMVKIVRYAGLQFEILLNSGIRTQMRELNLIIHILKSRLKM